MITRKVVWEYNGKPYESKAKAIDAAENDIFQFVKDANRLTQAEIKYAKMGEIAEYIIKNKQWLCRQLETLIDAEITTEDEE